MNIETTQFISDLLLGKRKLLQPGTNNTKLAKNESESYILNLAPAELNSYGKSVCPYATEGCKAACLNLAGLSKFKNIQDRRVLLSDLFFADRSLFLRKLQLELLGYNLKAQQQGNRITIRVNGTSDLAFYELIRLETGVDVVNEYTHLQLMDYTKSYPTWKRYRNTNYHLTFSYSGNNWYYCSEVLKQGENVAVVFYPQIPATYMGFRVVEGDSTDERYLDPQGVIIGLTYKKVKGVNPLENDFIVKV